MIESWDNRNCPEYGISPVYGELTLTVTKKKFSPFAHLKKLVYPLQTTSNKCNTAIRRLEKQHSGHPVGYGIAEMICAVSRDPSCSRLHACLYHCWPGTNWIEDGIFKVQTYGEGWRPSDDYWNRLTRTHGWSWQIVIGMHTCISVPSLTESRTDPSSECVYCACP